MWARNQNSSGIFAVARLFDELEVLLDDARHNADAIAGVMTQIDGYADLLSTARYAGHATHLALMKNAIANAARVEPYVQSDRRPPKGLRFEPYAPTSVQAREGHIGRWQFMNRDSVWVNCKDGGSGVRRPPATGNWDLDQHHLSDAMRARSDSRKAAGHLKRLREIVRPVANDRPFVTGQRVWIKRTEHGWDVGGGTVIKAWREYGVWRYTVREDDGTEHEINHTRDLSAA